MLAFLLPEDAADIHPRGQVRLHLLIFFSADIFRHLADIARMSSLLFF